MRCALFVCLLLSGCSSDAVELVDGGAELDASDGGCEPSGPFPMTMVGCTVVEAAPLCGDAFKPWACDPGLVVEGCCDHGPMQSGFELWCCAP